MTPNSSGLARTTYDFVWRIELNAIFATSSVLLEKESNFSTGAETRCLFVGLFAQGQGEKACTEHQLILALESRKSSPQKKKRAAPSSYKQQSRPPPPVIDFIHKFRNHGNLIATRPWTQAQSSLIIFPPFLDSYFFVYLKRPHC